MQTQIVKPRTSKLLQLDLVKSHMRLSDDFHDNLLNYLIEVATDWVEEELGKTLLTQVRKVIHNNNSFCLPYGPVKEVIEVKYHKKILSEGEYEVEPKGDSLQITVPFRWKSPDVEITYRSGFGDHADDVPKALQHAVLGTIEYLYENKGDLKALEHQTAPWLRAYRCYRVS